MSMRPTHGAQLPYQLLAGVVPVGSGWLIASAKWQGATIAPEEPHLSARFIDVLDYKPAYRVIAVFAPIGLPDEPRPRGRSCERDARSLLGVPRASAIASAPPRAALQAPSYEEAAKASGGRLSPITWRRMGKIAEVDEAIAPYWQRTVFEVHPELSFFQLGEDRPLRGWIFTIAHRRLVQHWRSGSRRPVRAFDPGAFDMLLGAADTESEAIESAEGVAAARALTADLSFDQAQVVLLRVLGGLSVEEVAAAIGKRPGTVRVLQHRALRRLAARLSLERVTR